MRHANANAYSDSHTNGYSHADVYPDSDVYTYSNSDSHTYADSNTNSNSDGNGYTYCACYSNTYAHVWPCRLAIGPGPASGPLCPPGRPRHGQHALHRRWPDRRQLD